MRSEQLDAIFAALADPTRRAIIARLRQGEATVTELTEPFQMSMPAVSKHLKVLERAGLISRGRDAQYRPRRLELEPLEAATAWIDEYILFRQESFGRLGELLREIQAERPPGTPDESD